METTMDSVPGEKRVRPDADAALRQLFPQNGLDQAGEVCIYGRIEPEGSEAAPLLFFTERLEGSLLWFRGSGLVTSSAARGGGRRPSLFPPPLRFGGPGLPPPPVAAVSTDLPPVTSEETPAAAFGRLMPHNRKRQKKWGNS
jgi:hypothetical protein